MITGCAQPRPSPSRKESAISAGTFSTKGKKTYAVPATAIAEQMITQERRRRIRNGTAVLTTKVATAKVDITTPIVPAARPICAP